MFENVSTLDLIIFFTYLAGMIAFGVYVTVKDKNESAQDYFLASRSLPWWAVGGSLIASNISTEQILAMNGSGFELGLAIATYEMMAALTLILVAKFLLPIFLNEGIYTMPQFLERRFDNRSRSLMSVFWIALFVFVNISTVLYLGGLAINSFFGVPLLWGIAALVLYSASFSIFGGLKAVVWTDVVQVVVLVVGGTLASYFVLNAVSGGEGLFAGLRMLYEEAPEHFEMIFERDDTYEQVADADGNGTVTESGYALLPGMGVLFGGMWITNLYYWGTNQYIIQRALAAQTLEEAQRGVAFAAVVKVILPLVVVVPGIAAFVLRADIPKADSAFAWVLATHVPIGIKGIVFAGLVAAVGSSISSMVNSASTIFTIDIYKDLIDKDASERKLVNVGRLSAVAALLIGASVAPALQNLGQAFQFIQEYTGFISPGVFAVFLFGMFWKRTTANAAFVTILIAIPISLAIRWLMPDLAFLDRMGVAFLVCCISLVGISMLETRGGASVEGGAHGDGSLDAPDVGRSTDPTARIYRVIVIGLLAMVPLATGLKMVLAPSAAEVWLGWLTLLATVILAAVFYTERGRSDRRAIALESGLFRTGPIFNVVAFGLILFLTAFYALFADTPTG